MKSKTKRTSKKSSPASPASARSSKRRNTKLEILNPKRGKIIVAVSGGFDPVHIGHVRMFNEARKLGDELVVILNNDNWLQLKKGYVFMTETERKEIIEAFEAVDRVVVSSHKEGTDDISICRELRSLRPHIFAKGGDRHSGEIPEGKTCEEIGCRIVNGVGHGGKVQSSSWLIGKMKLRKAVMAKK